MTGRRPGGVGLDKALTDSALSVARGSRTRLGILALMTIATLINYLDRTVMSIATPLISREFVIGPQVMGVVFSAFSWTYALSQIPGGIFLDRYGTRLTYSLSLLLWSCVTTLLGFADGAIWLVACLLGLGLFEAPCYPTNSRILSTWFPQQERASATGVYSIGQYAGIAFFSPVLFWILQHFGWRALFYCVGAIGIVFSTIMYACYRDPDKSRRVSQAELDHIAAGGGLAPKGAGLHFSRANVRRLLSHRQIVGASLGQFCSNSTLVFFLTWFPTYLATERHMTWIKVGFSAILPFAAAASGVLAGGLFSDFLLRRTGSANIARKIPIVTGLLMASTIISANYISDNLLVIAVMSVAFFGQGMCNLGWTVIADVAPKRLMGLTGGIFNFCANLAGILTPIVIGYLVSVTGSFVGGLAYVGVLALLGVVCYVFIVGDIHRLELQDL
jgi:MFS transporter, ACS family, D-galactonate transporter